MLGYANPAKMLQDMGDIETLNKFKQFYLEEPFGPGVANLMSAQIAAAAAHSDDPDAFLPLTASGDDE
jgi:hypothetical protein